MMRPDTSYSKFDEALGDRLRTLRETAKISQLELGSLIGVHQSTIGDLESGRARCSVQRLIKICDALKIKARIVVDSL